MTYGNYIPSLRLSKRAARTLNHLSLWLKFAKSDINYDFFQFNQALKRWGNLL